MASGNGLPIAFLDEIPMNDLTRAWAATWPEVHAAVGDVLGSGWYVQGPQHDAFEQELASFLGAQSTVGVASGTDALLLALSALGARPGTCVGTAPNAGGYASVSAALLGCDLAMVDVDERTAVITPESLARSAPGDLDILVITHLYGNVADTAGIKEWCRARSVRLVEDCAQSIGAWTGTQRAGTLGDLATFSFYPTKNLGAAGDGGAVVGNDEQVIDTVRALRSYGWAGKYDIARPGGVNSRLDEVQAAILRIGLLHLDDRNARRREIIGAYRSALSSSTAFRMVTRDDPECVAHLAVIDAGSASARQTLERELARARIRFSIHYPTPDHLQPALARVRTPPSLPGVSHLTGNVLTVPLFPEMRAAEVARVVATLSRTAEVLG